jgi:hypothetical protein
MTACSISFISILKIQLVNQRYTYQQQQETTKQELHLLQKRIDHNSLSAQSSSLLISRVPLFDSINNVQVQEQLYTQYKKIIEQSKIDMFNLYISSATTQMNRYQSQYNDGIKKMWQDQRLLSDNRKLTPAMIDLMEQRACIISERIKCIYNYKLETLSAQ